MARKFSLKDNPIFQRLEVPKPSQAINGAPRNQDRESAGNVELQQATPKGDEGQNLTLKNRPSNIAPPVDSRSGEYKKTGKDFVDTNSSGLAAKLLERDEKVTSKEFQEGNSPSVEPTEQRTTIADVASLAQDIEEKQKQNTTVETEYNDGGSDIDLQNLRLKNYPLISNQEDHQATEVSAKHDVLGDLEPGPDSPKPPNYFSSFPLEDHLEKSQFFGFYNEVTDNLLPSLNPAEQILYSRLFRLSYGFNRNYCTVSQQQLRERTGLSRNTVRTGLQSLVLLEWLYVIDAGNHVSTTYRVVLPREKNGVSNSDPHNLNLKNRGAKKDPLILRRKLRGSKIDRHEGQKTAVQNLTLKNQNKNFSSNQERVDQSRLNSDPQNLTPLLLTNNSFTLLERERKSATPNENTHISATQLVDSFYLLISQNPSSAKRERGVTECMGLLQDGFSTDQIQYALQWTVTQLPDTGSFSRVVHFIDQALRNWEEEQKRVQKKRSRDLDQEERRVNERQREVDEKHVDELRGSLSSEEIEQFTSEATELVAREHGDLRYGRETLIQIKIRELIRRKYPVS